MGSSQILAGCVPFGLQGGQAGCSSRQHRWFAACVMIRSTMKSKSWLAQSNCLRSLMRTGFIAHMAKSTSIPSRIGRGPVCSKKYLHLDTDHDSHGGPPIAPIYIYIYHTFGPYFIMQLWGCDGHLSERFLAGLAESWRNVTWQIWNEMIHTGLTQHVTSLPQCCLFVCENLEQTF